MDDGLDVGSLGDGGPPEVVAQPAKIAETVSKEIARNALIHHL